MPLFLKKKKTPAAAPSGTVAAHAQADEAIELDGLEEVVAKAVADSASEIAEAAATKAADAVVAKLGRQKATGHTDALPRSAEVKDEQTGEPVIASRGVEFSDEQPSTDGLMLARFARAQLHARLFGKDVENVLKAWGTDAVGRRLNAARKHFTEQQRGLNQGLLVDGGMLVPDEVAAELIPLLRNRAAVRQAGARVISMGASLTLPRQTSASTAAYIGEVQAQTPSKPQLGGIKLQEKKLGVLVIFSNDLAKNANLSLDAFVRDDMVQQAALKEDLQALFGVGSQYSPTGLEHLVASTRKYDSTAVDRKVPTLAEVRKEIAKAIKLVKNANSMFAKPAWLMNARTEEYLACIVDGNGNAVYEEQLAAGKLRGYPVIVTEQISEALANFAASTTDESRVFFGDWDAFIIGESMGGMEITVEPNVTYEEGGSTKSGFSRDESGVRLLMKHDFNIRHESVLTDVSWRAGAP